MSTYYVDTAVGGDGNAGTSAGAGNAWATIDKAMNTVAAGDKVWVKASGTYNELATIDTAGAAATPIVFEGYTTTTGDGGRATISGQSSRANCIVNNAALLVTTRIYYVFKNFRFTAATGAGVLLDPKHTTWKNCKFDTNGGAGLSAGYFQCEACEFTSNTSSGAVLTISGAVLYTNAVFIGCSFYGNTHGIDGTTGGSVVAIDCVFFSNSGTAFIMGTGADALGRDAINCMFGCTVDGDAKDTDTGVQAGSSTDLMAVVNTVLYDCTTGYSSGGDYGERVISRNNLVNANTTAYSSAATFTGEVTSAPGFVNEVAGADYHPDTGSPLKAAGFDSGASMDIGAVQSVPGVTANAFQLKIGV